MIQSQYVKSDALGIIHYHLNDFTMYFLVPDNTFFPYFFFACFKLRFDQADNLSVFSDEVGERGWIHGRTS